MGMGQDRCHGLTPQDLRTGHGKHLIININLVASGGTIINIILTRWRNKTLQNMALFPISGAARLTGHGFPSH